MKPHNRGFTLLEIMIIVGIIGIVISIAAPTWFRQREIARATACQENLAKIHQSVELYALENKKAQGTPVNYPDDLLQPNGVGMGSGYLKSVPQCPSEGVYDIAAVGDDPTCSIGATNSPFTAHELP